MIEELEEALEPYDENLDRNYPHPASNGYSQSNQTQMTKNGNQGGH